MNASSAGPQQVVIDAHQHIWDKAKAPYPWLTPDLSEIDRTFDFDELRPQLDETGVTATVLVQSSDDLADTDLMLEAAAAEPRVLGVVAWAPLDRPNDAAPLLDHFRADPVVVGLRSLIHNQPDPRWLERDDVAESLALLESSALPFDIVAVLPEHLECAIGLGERFPDLPLVIDHLGHPPFGGGGRRRWRDLLAGVAENPRASAKVSGLYPIGDPAAPERTERIRPVFDHAMALFGPDRLMFGGDWPISVLHGGYATTWRTLEPLLLGLDAADREALLHGTARRCYPLDEIRLREAGA